ncbi:MAG: hypothetical protein COT85_05270 [Chlamydiae bacterium CG10_big_fil_rev_8_21_14_0_10_42_34]|nr:MAG: hypothetical protein COT85_05270 [Chlamydiae bacterium CG10_big_fil_rev_8_21_14_0_10_42_34]
MGIDTSSRYARDKATLDTKLIEESRFIPSKTEVSVVKPYLPTEFEEYLFPNKLTLWASFNPPPDYLTYSKPLFSYQLIPSMGGYEKQEADTDKLEALEDTLNKEHGQGKQDQQEEERERKILMKLLKMVGKLDRTLIQINSRRSQYQRG